MSIGWAIACYVVCGVIYLLMSVALTKETEEEAREIDSFMRLPKGLIISSAIIGFIAIISVWPLYWITSMFEGERK